MSFLTLFFLYISTLFGSTDMPQKITVRRLHNTYPSDFAIEEEDELLGCVKSHFFQEIREYGFCKRGKELLARAKCTLSRACALFTIEVVDQGIIGYVEESNLAIRLFDEEKKIIATSETNYWETEIYLVDPEGEPLGALTRPYLRDHEGWSLILFDPVEWQKRSLLWLLLPVIQTDKAFWLQFPYFHDQKSRQVPTQNNDF